MKEKSIGSLPGIATLLGSLVLMLAGVAALILAIVLTKSGTGGGGLFVASGLVLVTIGIFVSTGLYMVQPNQAAVLSLFGKYVGTVKDNGLRWNNPFFTKKKVSQRVRNFESGKLKVNELDGSPIEIAAVIVWQVVDASEAVYNVDDYESFVHIQSESALRAMATRCCWPPESCSGRRVSISPRPTLSAASCTCLFWAGFKRRPGCRPMAMLSNTDRCRKRL